MGAFKNENGGGGTWAEDGRDMRCLTLFPLQYHKGKFLQTLCLDCSR